MSRTLRVAYAPNGARIEGTLEVVHGIALGFAVLTDDGIEMEYDGETKVDWDSQEPELDLNGQVQCVDEGGQVWSADQLHFKEEVFG